MSLRKAFSSPPATFGVRTVRKNPIPEIERRHEDFNTIDAYHPLRNLIVHCLENDPARRPRSKQLHAELRKERGKRPQTPPIIEQTVGEFLLREREREREKEGERERERVRERERERERQTETERERL